MKTGSFFDCSDRRLICQALSILNTSPGRKNGSEVPSFVCYIQRYMAMPSSRQQVFVILFDAVLKEDMEYIARAGYELIDHYEISKKYVIRPA